MNEIGHVTCSEWNPAHSRCSINASCYCFMGGRALVPKLGKGWAKEEKGAQGKVKGHLERRHCPPRLGQRSCLGHGRTEGLNLDFLGSPAPAWSYPCTAAMTHGQEASPADTCLAGSGGQREESSPGLSEPPVSMPSVPWQARQRTHAGPNQC